jgi:heme a synthase
LQLYVLRMISPSQQKNIQLPRNLYVLVYVIFGITFYQMFLGTQVREFIDELTKMGFGRETWTDKLGLPFLIHRSFSWLVLILLSYMAWKNEQGDKIKMIRWAFIVLALELISGVLLAYAEMPGLVQTAHLVFASILFGILLMLLFRAQSNRAIL